MTKPLGLHLLFVGPSGCGKDSSINAYVLPFLAAAQSKVEVFASGDMFRKITGLPESALTTIKGKLTAGELVPDPIVGYAFGQQAGRQHKQIASADVVVWNGIPRTGPQLVMFLAYISQVNFANLLVFEMTGEARVFAKRLLSRRQCKSCGELVGVEVPTTTKICPKCTQPTLEPRSDDTPELIKKRHGWFFKDTVAMMQSLRVTASMLGVDDRVYVHTISAELQRHLVGENILRFLRPAVPEFDSQK